MVEDDWADWKALWDGYLRFYRKELSEATSRSAFARLCQKADGMFGFVAASDSSLTGFAHALLHPSTWSTGGYCYLEDLFVAPAARGTGVGQSLIEAVVDEGRRRRAGRIYWHTQEFNGPARSLYDQVAHRTSFIVYQCP
jgi:GNAT superfamily N-acetyltransferase